MSVSFLFFLHVFVGIGAIGGGLAAILNPQEPLEYGVLLKNSPFQLSHTRSHSIYHYWSW